MMDTYTPEAPDGRSVPGELLAAIAAVVFVLAYLFWYAPCLAVGASESERGEQAYAGTSLMVPAPRSTGAAPGAMGTVPDR